ncbi:hypothetical protein AMAG_03331 [Allomyces macrogynus ATCC 38327]|uniref:FAD/NAD(P)-binding domain-containing protein n=1 Tax=Allomyces macrogynus (strain ATCC 38327) TaxID=578462 RepID=A0A0L0S974_ALLM3|nr:hypothetical protein AMAG_03331 [Allomyces macrogynus ATCC 38327]|eukprot:KNE58976.1 hypothetical protein AMAG_03331 [Allomyces macrogynus ATCC 38327]
MIAAPATTVAARAAATSAAVIGAGPAGLAVVARLLDTGAPRITWIDPAFNGGRLARYPEVPSNTKVALFLQYAAVSPALTKAADAASHDPRATLAALEQGKGCALVHAQKLCADLASALASAFPDRVDVKRGWVSAVHTTSAAGAEFAVDVVDGVKDDFAPNGTGSAVANGAKSTTVHAARLFLCTGSEPTPTPADPAPHAVFPHIQPVNAGKVSYDSASGALKLEGHGTVAGAHGFGIAFPERITDKWGNVEWSVGMWKFMRYIREVIV